MKAWPALDVHAPDEILFATLDEFSPTALEERDATLRAFFATPQQRDTAHESLTARGITADAIDVPDEDWAARSQQHLVPITVGRIVVVCDPQSLIANPGSVASADPQSPTPNPFSIVIQPSMGFGTGHHATTRLCLAALQTLDLRGAFVLDVGTGSGILAIAAARLGAARARGIDVDADAIQSANENLSLNPEAGNLTFAVADLSTDPLPRADFVTANLTGATLARFAPRLLGALDPGGTLIASGILAAEEASVRQAFSASVLVNRHQEDEWICLVLKKS